MQEKQGKTLLGALIVIVGILVLFFTIGISFGWIIPILLGAFLMIYGYRKIMGRGLSGSKGLGVIMFLLGFIILMNRLWLPFDIILAIVVIYLGLKMIPSRKETAHFDSSPSMMERDWAKRVLYEDKMDRFEREWKNRK
ncbi:hypothetical protein [Brevibacillus daliensis]|uniref:hypothetical protein n=1 Tax=Brevibacillus daliensis TaxID=2892995 RepID=UPI001E3F69CB|nr:hypothetical protein [Brevibacillus daliensis]